MNRNPVIACCSVASPPSAPGSARSAVAPQPEKASTAAARAAIPHRNRVNIVVPLQLGVLSSPCHSVISLSAAHRGGRESERPLAFERPAACDTPVVAALE